MARKNKKSDIVWYRDAPSGKWLPADINTLYSIADDYYGYDDMDTKAKTAVGLAKAMHKSCGFEYRLKK